MIERRTLLVGVASSLFAYTRPRAVNTAADEAMLRRLPDARRFARPPISNFHVGAVARGASGSLYLGANLEVPGNPLNQTVHAEQAAISNAYSAGEKGISALAVTDAPCGHCRQFLNEIADGARLRILIEGQQPRTLGELLPSSFGPRDLGIQGGMFSASPAALHLTTKREDAAAQAALQAASRSYAPYTKARSGCAITTASGKIIAGSYLENAAFNPSLSPLQSALVSLIHAGEEFAAIRAVTLVEMKDAAISQRAAAEAVLHAVAPGATLEVLLAS